MSDASASGLGGLSPHGDDRSSSPLSSRASSASASASASANTTSSSATSTSSTASASASASSSSVSESVLRRRAVANNDRRDEDDRKEGLYFDHQGSASHNASSNDQVDHSKADNADDGNAALDEDVDDDDDEEGDACRLCREGATADRPLFHPCRCKGSIRHVHQECLLDWLRRRPPRALDEATQAPVRTLSACACLSEHCFNSIPFFCSHESNSCRTNPSHAVARLLLARFLV